MTHDQVTISSDYTVVDSLDIVEYNDYYVLLCGY